MSVMPGYHYAKMRNHPPRYRIGTREDQLDAVPLGKRIHRSGSQGEPREMSLHSEVTWSIPFLGPGGMQFHCIIAWLPREYSAILVLESVGVQGCQYLASTLALRSRQWNEAGCWCLSSWCPSILTYCDSASGLRRTW